MGNKYILTTKFRCLRVKSEPVIVKIFSQGILGAAGSFGGFFLPTLLGWLKQLSGSYASGLAMLAALAVVALVILSVVQTEWVGVWIGKHGRVKEVNAV